MLFVRDLWYVCVRASMKAAKPLHIVLATNPNPTRARGYPLNINPKPDPKPDSISGPAGSGRVADLYHKYCVIYKQIPRLITSAGWSDWSERRLSSWGLCAENDWATQLVSKHQELAFKYSWMKLKRSVTRMYSYSDTKYYYDYFWMIFFSMFSSLSFLKLCKGTHLEPKYAL